MKQGRAAALAVLLLGCTLLLSGCAAWRESLLQWRQGRDGIGAQQTVTPEQQKEIDRLYARGAAALVRNDLDGAIVAWREGVRIAPTRSAQSRKLRGYLTLLDREAAKRFAQGAAAGERGAPLAPTDRLHVAVFPFTSQAAGGAAPAAASFNRAGMAMVMVDLARVPSLTVLEREKIDLLVQEMKLAASPLVERGSINAQARLLGAGTVVAGSVYNEAGPAGPGSGRYRINTAVSDVVDGRVVGTQEADGKQAEFFVLQKRVVYGILDTLQIKDFPPAVHHVHTRSWAAYAQFATGLGLLAEDRLDEARKAFASALEIDPAFVLAEEALLGTPDQGATLQGVRAELQSTPRAP